MQHSHIYAVTAAVLYIATLCLQYARSWMAQPPASSDAYAKYLLTKRRLGQVQTICLTLSILLFAASMHTSKMSGSSLAGVIVVAIILISLQMEVYLPFNNGKPLLGSV